MSVIQISAKELQKKIQSNNKPFLLDVREGYEFEFAHIEGSEHIPLSQVSQKINLFDHDTECVVICHHGVRSQQAALFLDNLGYHQIYNLNGGIDAWSVECDSTVLRY